MKIIKTLVIVTGILTLFFPALIIFGYGKINKLIWVDYFSCGFMVFLSLFIIIIGSLIE